MNPGLRTPRKRPNPCHPMGATPFEFHDRADRGRLPSASRQPMSANGVMRRVRRASGPDPREISAVGKISAMLQKSSRPGVIEEDRERRTACG
jgi:hypothetical protein